MLSNQAEDWPQKNPYGYFIYILQPDATYKETKGQDYSMDKNSLTHLWTIGGPMSSLQNLSNSDPSQTHGVLY